MTPQKSLLAPSESSAELISGMITEHQKFKTRAAEIIAALDVKIAEKSAEHHRLLGMVSIDNAVSLVMRDVDESAKDEHRHALYLIRSAGRLNHHVEVDVQSGANGSGEPTYNSKSPSPLHLLRNLSASGLVSLLPDLFRPAIEALVRQELASTGNPATGLSIADLKQQADTVLAELRNLTDQRIKSVKLLDNLLAEELKVPPEYYQVHNRQPAAHEYWPDSGVMVKHLDDAGNSVQKAFGHSWEQLMAARDAGLRADNAAQLKRDTAEFGEYSEGETYDTLRAKKS